MTTLSEEQLKRIQFLENQLRSAGFLLTGMPRHYEETDRIEELKQIVADQDKDIRSLQAQLALERQRRDLLERVINERWMSAKQAQHGQQYHIKTSKGQIFRAICVHRDGQPTFLASMPGMEVDATQVLPFPG